MLHRARDLGPSHATTADVLVALRGSSRPVALLRWGVGRRLRATWFTGQPTALLAASPAVLGRALGVRIDDFRLPGYGVFYASRGTGHIPAALHSEVAALGRISSFGQVHTASQVRNTESVPVRGLAPGGSPRRMTSGRCGEPAT